MQTKRLLRWMIVLMAILIILTSLAISIGKQYPTIVILASSMIWTGNYDQSELVMTDLSRNLSHRVPFPIQSASLYRKSFNKNGRNIFLALHNNRDYTFAIWDLDENRLVYPPLGYNKCDVVVFEDWLDDNIGVFQCNNRDSLYPEIEGFYTFDVRTGNVYRFHQFKDSRPFLKFSPANDRLFMLDKGVLYNITAQGEKSIIDIKAEDVKNVIWFPDGQSLLLVAPPVLTIYSLVDQSSRVISTNSNNFSNGISQFQISPNGEWITWTDNSWMMHSLHIPTGVDRILHNPNSHLEYSGLPVWSSDSQYMVVKLSNSGLNYLIKPDNSFAQLLGNGNSFIWSPDNQFLLYTYSNIPTDYLSIISVAKFLAGDMTPEVVISHATGAGWLSNGGIILFFSPSWSVNQLGYYHPSTGIRLLTDEKENVSYLTTLSSR